MVGANISLPILVVAISPVGLLTHTKAEGPTKVYSDDAASSNSLLVEGSGSAVTHSSVQWSLNAECWIWDGATGELLANNQKRMVMEYGIRRSTMNRIRPPEDDPRRAVSAPFDL